MNTHARTQSGVVLYLLVQRTLLLRERKKARPGVGGARGRGAPGICFFVFVSIIFGQCFGRLLVGCRLAR